MQRWSRPARWSFGLGGLSVVGCGLLSGIPAMVLGLSARRDIRLSGGALRGRGLAWAGVVLGLVGTVASLVLGALLATHLENARHRERAWAPPRPIPESAAGHLSRFYTQTVRWHPCDDAQCARITVPIDYAHAKGRTLSLALRVVPATGRGGRSLFVNPGGPGASAQEFASYLGTELRPSIRHRYDIVGLDPRGVAESTPIDCVSDRLLDRYTASDPDPNTPAEIDAYREETRQVGEGCKRRSGAIAAHVSTLEAARDMDVVRALLGRTKVDFFGASYGTQLGATYATLFPKHAGRMVLDGAVGPTLGSLDASLGQARGFGRALDAYLRDCVRSSDCPLGRKVGPAKVRIRHLLARLDRHPMKAADKRWLTEGQAFYGIAYTLYERASWPGLTSGLSAALKGDGTVLLHMSDAYFERDPSGRYDGNLAEAYDAITCLDTGDRTSLDDVREAMPRFRKASSVFGSIFAWGALRCADWPMPALHPQGKVDATGAGPILVLGTTRDPATPYEWAEQLAAELKPGVLVTRVGDGHTAYLSDNHCVRRVVDRYLAHGDVPKKGTVCGE